MVTQRHSTTSTCCECSKHVDHLLILSIFPKQAFSFNFRQIFLVLVFPDHQLSGPFPWRPISGSHSGRISSPYFTRRRFGKKLDLANRKQKAFPFSMTFLTSVEEIQLGYPTQSFCLPLCKTMLLQT